MGAGKLNGKASFNSAILPGGNHAYPEATWPERENIIQRHRNFALGVDNLTVPVCLSATHVA